MHKKISLLAVLSIFAVHFSTLFSASAIGGHHSQTKQSDAEYEGYWLSYPGNECLKCNCSFTAKFIPTFVDISILLFIDKSDCDGDGIPTQTCYCRGNPDFLVGSRYQLQSGSSYYMNGSMGDSTCFGLVRDYVDPVAINCQGRQRSETLMFTKSNKGDVY